jgi:tetratricopeptide (TPR) repeat protein
MKLFAIFFVMLFVAACDSNAPRPVSQGNNGTNTAERPRTAIAHGPQEQTPPPAANGSQSKWTQSGDAFDTSELDSTIAKAEKDLSKKPDDAAAKKALAEAYLKRGIALTDKRQYASALGDYRRTLKYDPANAEAKEWIDKIVMIYESINRSYPAEGQEPPPLPFKKG